MLVASTLADLRKMLPAPDMPYRGVALVPTMGALHPGHLALVAAAREAAPFVAASIFVNPTQFETASDLARYPRDAASDLEALRGAGCDLAWMPDVATMYPEGDATTITVAGPALGWEGTARPGHFSGVATVVAKLFGQIRPEFAFFGEKDWQQLQVIRRMTADIGLPVRIHGVATMRDADGLAMSSRNRFLSDEQRRLAPMVFAQLQDVAAKLRAGKKPAAVLQAATDRLRDAGFAPEYLALVDGSTLLPIDTCKSGARLLAAARLGTVRLLDNTGIDAAGTRDCDYDPIP